MADALQSGSNEVERRRWNDAYWSSVWPRREQLTDAVTEVLLDHLSLRPGERVLDIGSGGGLTSIAAGRVVGATGSVLGADISEPLVAFARRRVTAHGVANVAFEVADVQHETLDGGPFDGAMSQFGVMFFDEPVTAFRNIARQLLDGGRLGFACWQPMARNAWHIGHAVGPYVPPPVPPSPGKSPTGPFSLGDPHHVTTILEAAAWTGVVCNPYEKVVTVERDAIVDDAQLTFIGVPDDCLAKAHDAVERHLARFRRDDGRLDVPIAFQVVTAQNGQISQPEWSRPRS